MPVLKNIGLLVTCREEGGQEQLHPLAQAALAWSGERIGWVGAEKDLPREWQDEPAWDAGGRLVLPGLIDCHTHLAFGGWRAGEFVQRLEGKTYREIARQGGGILSTVKATRESPADQLIQRCRGFLQEICSLGVTCLECKSGYGLEWESERKILEVYGELSRLQPVRIVPTFLGAHVVPPEYREKREEYVRLLTEVMIPEVARRKLARFCDVFLEESAFSLEEARRILQVGREYGLPPKLHADQLSDGGGALLAARLKAVSADHLEHASPQGIQAMAEAGVVAVALPLATLHLGQPPMPLRSFRRAGVPVAVATDFNPGSAPSYHLPLALTLACTLMGMKPAEAVKGATIYAAKAVGMETEIGSLERGKKADFCIIDAPDVEHWLYHFRPNACLQTVVGGKIVWASRS